jgi:D-glycero-alpha-D-manno-heptose-7-phosphate kinase
MEYVSSVRARAPLRLGLAGGGTDLSPFCDKFGGFVLNATVSLFAYAILNQRDDGQVKMTSADRGDTFEGRAESTFDARGPLVLHLGVYNRIVRQFCGGQPLAVTLTTYSDVPAGSGLGSSSALVVAMVQAYAELLSLPLGEYDVARLAYEIERVDLLQHGGRQDQYAAAFGGFNFIEFYEQERVIVNPLRVKEYVRSELECSMVLYYTGVSRISSQIISQQQHNIATGDDASLKGMQHLKQNAIDMKEAILKGDIPRVGELLGMGWRAKKETAKGISSDSIEQAFVVALESGAYAGKVSGAGGGGFCMFMADPAARQTVVNALSALPGKVLNCNFTGVGATAWRIRTADANATGR